MPTSQFVSAVVSVVLCFLHQYIIPKSKAIVFYSQLACALFNVKNKTLQCKIGTAKIMPAFDFCKSHVVVR